MLTHTLTYFSSPALTSGTLLGLQQMAVLVVVGSNRRLKYCFPTLWRSGIVTLDTLSSRSLGGVWVVCVERGEGERVGGGRR